MGDFVKWYNDNLCSKRFIALSYTMYKATFMTICHPLKRVTPSRWKHHIKIFYPAHFCLKVEFATGVLTGGCFVGLDSQQRMTIFLQKYRFTHTHTLHSPNDIDWFGLNCKKCTRSIFSVMVISAWNPYGPYHQCSITYVMAWVYNSILWVSVGVWRISHEWIIISYNIVDI